MKTQTAKITRNEFADCVRAVVKDWQDQNGSKEVVATRSDSKFNRDNDEWETVIEIRYKNKS